MQQTLDMCAVAGGSYVIEATFACPIGVVWAAITRKELIDKYYFLPIGADITAPGAEIYYGPPSQKLITGTVIAVEAPHSLQHSFRFAEEADKAETMVTYTLAAAGTGTHLRIEHCGYAVDSQGYADISGGWPIIVDGLKAVVSNGARGELA